MVFFCCELNQKKTTRTHDLGGWGSDPEILYNKIKEFSYKQAKLFNNSRTLPGKLKAVKLRLPVTYTRKFFSYTADAI